MNIIHLESSPGWGGQEIRILREAIAMRKKGHALFFVIEKGGGLAARARDAGFPVYEIRFAKKRALFVIGHLISIFRRHGIDLVNTHSSEDSWLGGIAARLSSIPIVRTRHLSTPIRGGLNGRLLYGALADFVVTTCASIVPSINALSKRDPATCRSIPTGIDLLDVQTRGEDESAFRASLQVKEGDFLVGTACFMRSWKGVADLIEAASLLRHETAIRWVAIGGGHIDTYRELAKKKGVTDFFSFTGHLERPFAPIAALDAFALVSTAHEGVSQAILQAAFLQRPLIATMTGGLSEVCLDRKTGLTVPIKSPEKIAEAVLFLRDNRALAKEWGKAAKELVLGHFTFDQTVEAMEEVYRSIGAV